MRKWVLEKRHGNITLGFLMQHYQASVFFSGVSCLPINTSSLFSKTMVKILKE
jgi:hypothetical protein